MPLPLIYYKNFTIVINIVKSKMLQGPLRLFVKKGYIVPVEIGLKSILIDRQLPRSKSSYTIETVKVMDVSPLTTKS